MLLGICKHVILCIHILGLAVLSLVSLGLTENRVNELAKELREETWPYQ